MKLEISRKFFETQVTNFTKVRPVEAELFHAEGRRGRQTDMTKLTVVFRKLTKDPKKKEKTRTKVARFPRTVSIRSWERYIKRHYFSFTLADYN
jgi:hypothetical protein